MHIYEEIDNLHIRTFTVKYFYPLFANSNKTTALINIEIDEKMRCYINVITKYKLINNFNISLLLKFKFLIQKKNKPNEDKNTRTSSNI